VTDYLYPNERLTLLISPLLVGGVTAFTSLATVCGSALFVLAMVAVAYWMNRAHHAALLQHAEPVTADTSSALADLIERTAARLDVHNVRTFVAGGQALNAYTFGLGDPKGVALSAGLFRAL